MLNAVREEFKALLQGPDERLELDRGALLIAKSLHPTVDVDAYLQRIDLMAEHVQHRLKGHDGSLSAIRELNHYLFEDEGFSGNREQYYDPRNSFLNDVLDRRTGIPVTLSILYMELGRRLGLPLSGTGLPGHFVVRCDLDVGTFFLDPYNRGNFLQPADCRSLLLELFGPAVVFDARFLDPMPRRRILSRVINNLRAIFLHAREPLSVLQMIDLLLCIDPDLPDELRARGLLYYQLEVYGQAALDLERYLQLVPDAEDAMTIRKQLETARALRARMN